MAITYKKLDKKQLQNLQKVLTAHLNPPECQDKAVALAKKFFPPGVETLLVKTSAEYNDQDYDWHAESVVAYDGKGNEVPQLDGVDEDEWHDALYSLEFGPARSGDEDKDVTVFVATQPLPAVYTLIP